MRTFLIALIVALATWPLPAAGASRNFGITSFERIRIEGPFQVRLATGVAPFARASGSPRAIERVAIEMRGDTLIVRSAPSWGGYPGVDAGPVEVSIGTHDLTKATLTGAGAIVIDRVKGLSFALSVEGSGSAEIGQATADQLNVTVVGTARAKLAGRAGKLSALVRGVSSLEAAGLTTPNAAISADGTSTVEATVTDIARVDAWGPTTIRFSGQPSCTLKVSGSSTVSGCRSNARGGY